MLQMVARTATRDEDAGRYQRHRPKQTLLYQIVEEYYPAFAGHMAERDRELPDYLHREFEGYLKCGRLEHGFLRVRCESCHAEHLFASRPEIMGRVPGIVYRVVTTHLVQKGGPPCSAGEAPTV